MKKGEQVHESRSCKKKASKTIRHRETPTGERETESSRIRSGQHFGEHRRQKRRVGSYGMSVQNQSAVKKGALQEENLRSVKIGPMLSAAGYVFVGSMHLSKLAADWVVRLGGDRKRGLCKKENSETDKRRCEGQPPPPLPLHKTRKSGVCSAVAEVAAQQRGLLEGGGGGGPSRVKQQRNGGGGVGGLGGGWGVQKKQQKKKRCETRGQKDSLEKMSDRPKTLVPKKVALLACLLKQHK